MKKKKEVNIDIHFCTKYLKVIINLFKISIIILAIKIWIKKYMIEHHIKHTFQERTFENLQQQTVSSVYQNTECLQFLATKSISSISSYTVKKYPDQNPARTRTTPE